MNEVISYGEFVEIVESKAKKVNDEPYCQSISCVVCPFGFNGTNECSTMNKNYDNFSTKRFKIAVERAREERVTKNLSLI